MKSRHFQESFTFPNDISDLVNQFPVPSFGKINQAGAVPWEDIPRSKSRFYLISKENQTTSVIKSDPQPLMLLFERREFVLRRTLSPLLLQNIYTKEIFSGGYL